MPSSRRRTGWKLGPSRRSGNRVRGHGAVWILYRSSGLACWAVGRSQTDIRRATSATFAEVGEDITPWHERSAELPVLPTSPPAVQRLSETQRRLRVLASLCREACADDADYRRILVVALEAGPADERQAQWIREQVLDAAAEERLRLTPALAVG